MRIWDVPETEPYPAPAVSSRDGVMEPAPQPIVSLRRDMQAAGWSNMIQYALGSMPHSTTGRPLAPKPSWALRAERDGVGAVAVYRGGAWNTMYTWSSTVPYLKHPNITAFRSAVLEA